MTELEVTDRPAEEDLRFLEDRINEHNCEATGMRDGRSLCVLLRDAGGAIRAGLSGHTWGGCCEVRFLWVREAERRRGLGSRLLEVAEQEAIARGCATLVLATHTFQAPDFYLERGYAVAGRVDGYPRGHAHLTLCKSLEGAPPDGRRPSPRS